ncbi:MAG TPA: RluA family pseudouridine synthase [Candidatus Acidoferrales bacterium]
MPRRIAGRISSEIAHSSPVAFRRITATAADAGQRLDVYLAARLPELSRTRIQELIDEGHVRIGQQVPRRAQPVAAGDIIEIEVLPRGALTALPEEIPIDLLYEDEDLVVVNKPAGMTVHAGAGVASGTLVNALLHRLGTLSETGGSVRPGIVHRLDRGTSGVIVVARNDAAHRALAAQFRERMVRKTYIALLSGRVRGDAGPRDSMTIDLPISRDPRRRTRMTARLRKGREARTDWRVLLRMANFTLVAAEPHTGRTHQIRAHFAAIGHPLVGDTLYGAPARPHVASTLLAPLHRVFLHAAKLSFAHPRTGQPVEVRSPLDPALRAYLSEIARAVKIDTRQVDSALRAYL